METVDKAQLRTWLGAVEAEVAQLRDRALGIEREQASLAHRANLIRQLLGEETPATPTSSPGGSFGFRDALRVILHEAGRPLHVDDIRAQLRRRSIEVPGKGADANIIAHLRRIPGVVRAAKGTYVLSDGTPITSIAPARKKRRKRRARRKPARVTTGDLAANAPKGARK